MRGATSARVLSMVLKSRGEEGERHGFREGNKNVRHPATGNKGPGGE